MKTALRDRMMSITFKKNHVVFALAVLSYLWVVITFSLLIIPLFESDAKTFFTGRQDFLRSYTVSEMILRGHPEAIYDSALYMQTLATHTAVLDTGWLYPPIYLPVAHLLAYMPVKISFAAWVLAQAALFFAVSYRFLWFRAPEALVLWSPGIFLALSWGQNGVLIAALYIAAFRWLHTRPLLSGLFFGCCAIKPQLGLLVPVLLLAGRYYKVFVAAFVTAVALVLLSLMLYGTQAWVQYAQEQAGDAFSLFLSHATHGTHHESPILTTLYKTLYNMPTVYHMMHSFGFSLRLSMVLQCAAGVWCVWQIIRGRRDGGAAHPLAALVNFSLLSSLAFPYFNGYDYVLLTAAISGMVIRSGNTAKFSAAGVACILAIYLIVLIHQEMTGATGVIIAPAIVALVYLYVNRNKSAPGMETAR